MKMYKRQLLQFYTGKQESEQVLILCASFSLFMLACRIIYTGNIMFAFLLWNLFLAFIPYAYSKWISGRGSTRYKLKFILCISVWLVFIPNAFYIITDLFHLENNHDMPIWFDLALILSFAWNGLLFGILSVRQMELLFVNSFKKKPDLFFTAPVMVLNGLGIYIGRYLRFNSWDVITNPFQLAGDIVYLFVHPIRNRFDWSMIVCYAGLLMIIYFTIKKIGKVM